MKLPLGVKEAVLGGALWGVVLATGAGIVYWFLACRRAEARWRAGCNGLRLGVARLTWMGDLPNRIGWLETQNRGASGGDPLL